VSAGPTRASGAAIVRTWPRIAAHIGVGCEDTALAYARITVDPLPIAMVRGVPEGVALFLDEWAARRNGGLMRDGSVLERCEDVDEMAEAAGVTRSSLLRLSRRPLDPFPLMGKRRRRWAYVAAQRDWLARQTVPFQAADRVRAA
jgi:hypothetical protein